MNRTVLPLAGAFAAAVLCITTGCGTSDPADKPQGPAQLNYWTWAPNMDKVVQRWNSTHPDVEVTVNKQDGGDPAVAKLLTAIKAGSGAPDVMQAEYQKIPTLVAANALADISGKTRDLQSRFPASVWASVTLGSKAVYGVPQDSGPMMFYYRSDVFEQLGLKAPATWDDYAAAARRVHQANPRQYLGTFSATDAGWFAGLAQQAGASWWGVKGTAWTVAIDEPATRRVAGFWGGLVQEGVIANSPMYTPDWNAGLNDGTQVGWVSAVWGPGVLAGNAASTKGKWKAAPMPQWDAANPATGNWGGSATSVASQSRHKAQAAEFVAWLNTDPVAVKALASEASVYPAVTAATAGGATAGGANAALNTPPDFFSQQADFYAIAAAAAQATRPFTYGPNVNVAYSAYNDAFGKAAESKQATAFTAALAAMQQTTVADLKATGFTVAS